MWAISLVGWYRLSIDSSRAISPSASSAAARRVASAAPWMATSNRVAMASAATVNVLLMMAQDTKKAPQLPAEPVNSQSAQPPISLIGPYGP